VGGYAVIGDTEPWYTKDLDLWTEPLEANVQKLLIALARFGPPPGMSIQAILLGLTFFKLGSAPFALTS
jgi:hypothetical protein